MSNISTNVLSNEPIVGVLGGLPVAEQTQDYFLVFQQAGGTGPEIIGQTAYFITYLVKSDGTVSKPSEDNDALLNLQQNFPVGKPVVVRLDQGTALNSVLGGEHVLTAIGRQQPICYTQTDFYVNTFTTASDQFKFILQGNGIEYDPETGAADLVDYRGYIAKNDFSGTSDLPKGTITGYDYRVDLDEDVVTSDLTNGIIEIDGNNNFLLESLGIKAVVRVKKVGDVNFPTIGRPFKFRLEVNKTGTWEEVAVQNNYVSNAAQSFTINFSLEGLDLTNSGDNVSFRITTDYLFPLGYFELLWAELGISDQSPPPGLTSITASGNQWVTSDYTPPENTPVWLTASTFLSLNYGNQQDSSVFNTADGFNLSPIVVPFEIRKGDRIRFRYSKKYDYAIYDIIPPNCSNDGLLKIQIKDLPFKGDSDFIRNSYNNFIIHRTDGQDPLYIILDVDKNKAAGGTQNFSGLILPKYPTQELIDNLDNIIINLKERGIIVDNLN